MKILIISQYFSPENLRINDLVFSLSDRGHQVTVLTGKPNYPRGTYFKGYSWKGPNFEEIKGVPIHRANLLLRKNGGGLRLFLNYFSFVWFACWKLFSIPGRYDKILVYAPSPITVGFVGIMAKWRFKAPVFLWIHDLWPESVRVAGGVTNTIALKLVDWMTKCIYFFSDHLLVQSPAFKKYLNEQNIPDKKIKFYPYYAEDFYKPLRTEKLENPHFKNDFNLVFAGNIGVAQSFDTIIDAAQIIKEKKQKIGIVVYGEGRDKKRILEKIKNLGLTDYFEFRGSFPPEKMPEFFAFADVLLITLKSSDIFSFTIPGKLQSYLACQRPIIGAIDGVAAQIIEKSKGGLVGPAENAVRLAENILTIKNLPKATQNQMAIQARTYFDNEFEKQGLLMKLEKILG